MDKEIFDLSGVQLLYANEMQQKLEVDLNARCRICGGPLTKNHFNAHKKISSSWTDEAICQAKDSADLCEACSWMTSGSNRSKIFHNKSFLVSSAAGTAYLDYADILNFLRTDLNALCPAVLMLRGKDTMNNSKKHQQWKANHAITYSRHAVRVVMCELQIFKNAKVDGIAEFDADEMINTVQRMQGLAEKELAPTMVYMKSNWQKANYIWAELLRLYASEQQFSLSIFLATMMTAYGLYPEEKKVDKKAS
jgi:hypothetical protein